MFNPEQTYYIYCYLDEAGEPYYFGKGKGYRAWKNHRSVEVPPDDRIKIIMEDLDEEIALRCEKICIDFYGREKDGGTLKNKWPGGTKGAPKGKEHHLYGKEGYWKGKTGAQSPRSLKYFVTSPTGETYDVHGLAAFCREHGLHQGNMTWVAKGKLRQYKGWQCAYLE